MLIRRQRSQKEGDLIDVWKEGGSNGDGPADGVSGCQVLLCFRALIKHESVFSWMKLRKLSK